MISVFKWWWAWDYEIIEDWLESMEAGGLRLIETRLDGTMFCFEKCDPAKARYCIDYQSKLTPEYLAIISDDGWKLHQIGLGWYILRKEYETERPELYTDFEGLLTRNRTLLTVMIIISAIELLCIGNLVWNAYKFPDSGNLAFVSIFIAATMAFFAFIITNLAIQNKKFRKRN